MFRAVIFDFDGVITDSEILHLRAFNQVLAQYSIEITTKDYYKDYLGLTDLDCFQLVARKGRLGLDSQQIENLIKQKNQVFEKLAKIEARIFEGVHDFLRMLRQNRIRLAIYSGAVLAEIEPILEESRLRSFFEAIVSAEQIEKGKPDPEGFLLALQELNSSVIPAQAAIQNPILPNECIVIEDSHWGLEAAKAAGMHAVAITNTYDAEQLSMAEKVVTKLSELSIDDLQELCI